MLQAEANNSIAYHFGQIDDPRHYHSPPHSLIAIISIALCGLICGADDWDAIEAFGKAKQAWLATWLPLPHGIPSADTFGRVIGQIDPGQFQQSFTAWSQAFATVSQGEIVAVDGKTLRGSRDQSSGQAALHLVSAWASQNRLVLGQVAVAAKSNEITAIPELLRRLALDGCIVTIDALGCQKEIATQIVEQGADYVLALKDNHKKLSQEVQRLFDDARQEPARGIAYRTHQTINKGHGRLETRTCYTISDPAYLTYLDPQQNWTKLGCVVCLVAERRLGEQTSTETRYYLSSLDGDPAQLNHAIRTHWAIENDLHWSLDVSFREDASRVRAGYGAENLALLRHIALNLLKRDRSAKLSIKNKRLRAGWDHPFLLHLLSLLT